MEGGCNEDQEIPPKGGQDRPDVTNGPKVGNVTLEEIKTSVNLFSQTLMT